MGDRGRKEGGREKKSEGGERGRRRGREGEEE